MRPLWAAAVSRRNQLLVSENPYQPPIRPSISALPSNSRNVFGRIGFSLSLAGVIGLFVVGLFGPAVSLVGMCISFLCLPGLVLSIVGTFRTPRRLAGYGVALGVFGSLYLPTFYLSIPILDTIDEPEVFTGDPARSRIDAPIPVSAIDVYLCDGGNWNGVIRYWACTCTTLDECWSVVASHSGIDKGEFQPWRPSQYAVVMSGPGFYGDQLATPFWDVASIKNGFSYENVEGDHRSMRYYAIDSDKRRVYYHRESGGFPPDVVDK